MGWIILGLILSLVLGMFLGMEITLSFFRLLVNDGKMVYWDSKSQVWVGKYSLVQKLNNKMTITLTDTFDKLK